MRTFSNQLTALRENREDRAKNRSRSRKIISAGELLTKKTSRDNIPLVIIRNFSSYETVCIPSGDITLRPYVGVGVREEEEEKRNANRASKGHNFSLTRTSLERALFALLRYWQ